MMVLNEESVSAVRDLLSRLDSLTQNGRHVTDASCSFIWHDEAGESHHESIRISYDADNTRHVVESM